MKLEKRHAILKLESAIDNTIDVLEDFNMRREDKAKLVRALNELRSVKSSVELDD